LNTSKFVPEALRGLTDAELAIKVLEGHCAECYAQPFAYADMVHYPWCTKTHRDPMNRYRTEYYKRQNDENTNSR
jgi:hypothetical protein